MGKVGKNSFPTPAVNNVYRDARDLITWSFTYVAKSISKFNQPFLIEGQPQ